jgi:hypothetical protein
MAITKIKTDGLGDSAVTSAKISDGAITNADIKSDAAITASKLSATLDLSSKTVTLPAASVTAHATTPTKTSIEALGIAASSITGALPAISGANLTGIAIPTLDSPSITGTLSVDSGGTVSHTISNWSDDVTYVITPTNCTVGSITTSGVFVVTHTSGAPSYTIKATTDSLGLVDSSVVTKNILMNLSAPTINSPADDSTLTNVVYTITSTDSNDDKIILDMGSSNFNFSSVSVGTASKVGNTVECIGFTTSNPAVTIQFTAEATYSVTAKSVNIAGTYGDSPLSSVDSITISNLITATGGTVTTDGDYKIHRFTSGGTFQVLDIGNGSNTIEYLLVAGGGGGGQNGGGGGGAGGVLYGASFSPAAQSYLISIGSGGARGNNNSDAGDPGGSTTGLGYTAIGGGGGDTRDGGSPTSGGSGGGGSSGSSGASGTAGQGNAGGNGSGGGCEATGGGGGGASAAGTNGASNNPGIGGNGVTRIGYSVGGGGGAGVTCGGMTSGGSGGGGSNGGAGTTNTGGGGGGHGYNTGSSGNGGSGVAVFKYKFQ